MKAPSKVRSWNFSHSPIILIKNLGVFVLIILQGELPILCACLNQFWQKLQNLTGVWRSFRHREKRRVSREIVRLQAKSCVSQPNRESWEVCICISLWMQPINFCGSRRPGHLSKQLLRSRLMHIIRPMQCPSGRSRLFVEGGLTPIGLFCIVIFPELRVGSDPPPPPPPPPLPHPHPQSATGSLGGSAKQLLGCGPI